MDDIHQEETQETKRLTSLVDKGAPVRVQVLGLTDFLKSPAFDIPVSGIENGPVLFE